MTPAALTLLSRRMSAEDAERRRLRRCMPGDAIERRDADTDLAADELAALL